MASAPGASLPGRWAGRALFRLLIAADRDATGRRAAATLEARALAQGIAATVLTPEGGDFNDDLAAPGPRALAARLGHDMM